MTEEVKITRDSVAHKFNREWELKNNRSCKIENSKGDFDNKYVADLLEKIYHQTRWIDSLEKAFENFKNTAIPEKEKWLYEQLNDCRDTLIYANRENRRLNEKINELTKRT